MTPDDAKDAATGAAVPVAPGASPALERLDVRHVLRGYRDALALAASWRAVENSQSNRLRRILRWLRLPRLEVERYLVDHMRATTAALARGYARRHALGEDDAQDAADRMALTRFVDSLPAPRPRVWLVMPLLLALVLTQAAVTAIGDSDLTAVLHDLVGLVDIKPADIAGSVDGLLHTNALAFAAVVCLGGVSLWLVFGPWMRGFRVKRIILNAPGAIGRRRARTPLGRAAVGLDVRGRELALCRALNLPPPSESSLDLWVPAAALGAAMIIAGFIMYAAMFGDTAHGAVLGVGRGLAALVALRAAHLIWRAAKRHGDAPGWTEPAPTVVSRRRGHLPSLRLVVRRPVE